MLNIYKIPAAVVLIHIFTVQLCTAFKNLNLYNFALDHIVISGTKVVSWSSAVNPHPRERCQEIRFVYLRAIKTINYIVTCCYNNLATLRNVTNCLLSCRLLWPVVVYSFPKHTFQYETARLCCFLIIHERNDESNV